MDICSGDALEQKCKANVKSKPLLIYGLGWIDSLAVISITTEQL